ncbi:MAG TPA: response regulator, partial [Micavibrio sp.]|nr:response regulator [Micavibrio sp.]
METLLLIDDDKSLRYLLRESLEKNDFVVIEAMNGARSIEILKQHHVDAILLDLHLPDGYGVDLIPQIRELTNVPLIIVSGDQEKSCRIEGLDAGADDYVIKPFSTKELVARIKANLRRYHGLQKPGSKDESTNDN